MKCNKWDETILPLFLIDKKNFFSMKKSSAIISFLSMFFFFLLLSVSAREENNSRETPAKELSAKDKEVIIEIFKTIDVSLYRFEFTENETYGTKVLPKAMWYSLRSGKKGTLSGSIVQNYNPAINFWF